MKNHPQKFSGSAVPLLLLFLQQLLPQYINIHDVALHANHDQLENLHTIVKAEKDAKEGKSPDTLPGNLQSLLATK